VGAFSFAVGKKGNENIHLAGVFWAPFASGKSKTAPFLRAPFSLRGG
jgi:hypothetical protein